MENGIFTSTMINLYCQNVLISLCLVDDYQRKRKWPQRISQSWINPIFFTRKYGVSPDPLLKGTWLIPTQDILLLEMDFEGNSFYIMWQKMSPHLKGKKIHNQWHIGKNLPSQNCRFFALNAWTVPFLEFFFKTKALCLGTLYAKMVGGTLIIIFLFTR